MGPSRKSYLILEPCRQRVRAVMSHRKDSLALPESIMKHSGVVYHPSACQEGLPAKMYQTCPCPSRVYIPGKKRENEQQMKR